MKIMYFGFEGFDTTNGTNHLALTMINSFLDHGHDVHLLSSHSKGINDDIPKILLNKENFTYDIVLRGNVEKRNFIKRYIDGFRYSFKCMKKWRKIRNLDIVILQSTPTVFFSAILLKLFSNAPIIFNSYDIFPDGPFMMGAINNKFMYKVLKKMQSYVYRASTKIVVISNDMFNSFVKMGISREKLVLIPNWYDEKQVKKISKDKNKFILNNSIDVTKFHVQYAGNFGYTFNYKIIIELAKLLLHDKEIVFQMIGNGGFENDFKREVEFNKLTNIEFFPWQPSDIIADVYNSASIEIIPLSKGVIYNSYPSKTSLLMACGKTFVCINEIDSEFYNYINKNGIGFCFSNDELDKTAEKIIYLKNNPEKLKVIEENANDFGMKFYSSDVNIQKYLNIFDEIKENR